MQKIILPKITWRKTLPSQINAETKRHFVRLKQSGRINRFAGCSAI